ncbi:MAG: hypothetical protein IT337_07390 [Thermomicrobiales bacterium]|nr:hypothetical protein [Thermomicrobiales bacterium]
MGDTTLGIDPTIESDDLSDTRLPEAILATNANKTPTLTADLLGADLNCVQAEHVSLEGSGAESVTAERVSIANSGVRSIEAKSVQVENSGVLALQSERVVLHDSAAISVVADEARLVGGRTLFLTAGSVTLDEDTRTLVADGPENVVRPFLSTQGAAALGAAFAIVLALLGRLLGRRRA